MQIEFQIVIGLYETFIFNAFCKRSSRVYSLQSIPLSNAISSNHKFIKSTYVTSEAIICKTNTRIHKFHEGFYDTNERTLPQKNVVNKLGRSKDLLVKQATSVHPRPKLNHFVLVPKKAKKTIERTICTEMSLVQNMQYFLFLGSLRTVDIRHKLDSNVLEH